MSGSIVTTFLQRFLNKGHCLYNDNWYSSPDLFKYLHDNTTNACGTVKTNRVGMPKYEVPLEVGAKEVCNDGTVVALRWPDKREVNMLTTEHTVEMVRTGKVNPKTKKLIIKPNCIHEYNCRMGAVDRSDMMIVNVECVRQFFHLFDLAILNSHALYLFM